MHRFVHVHCELCHFRFLSRKRIYTVSVIQLLRRNTMSEAIVYQDGSEEPSDEELFSSDEDEEPIIDTPQFDFDPWGNYRTQNEKKDEKKPRIQRTGKVPLHLSRNYGQRSGWDIRQGFRELIQNLFDHHFIGLTVVPTMSTRTMTEHSGKLSGSVR